MSTLIWKLSTSEGFEEDALQEALAIERQSQSILRDAEAEVEKIITEAKQKVYDLKTAAEAKASEEARATVRKSVEELEEQIRIIREQADRDAETWFQAASIHYQAGLAYVLELVTMSEAQEA